MNKHAIFNCVVKARHSKNHNPGTISDKIVKKKINKKERELMNSLTLRYLLD